MQTDSVFTLKLAARRHCRVRQQMLAEGAQPRTAAPVTAATMAAAAAAGGALDAEMRREGKRDSAAAEFDSVAREEKRGRSEDRLSDDGLPPSESESDEADEIGAAAAGEALEGL